MEPIVQGCAGMRIYPPLYLKKLRALCDEYGVLLIADEIATGFGRTGNVCVRPCRHYTGYHDHFQSLDRRLYADVHHAVTDKIYDAFYADYFEYKAFMHSHTYAGNPLGCSAALATLDILQNDGVLAAAQDKAVFLHNALEDALGKHPNVGEIRHIGLINAIELVKDPATKEPLPSKARTGYQIYKKALDHGLLLRPLGDVLYFNPPLNTDNKTLTDAIDRTVESFADVLGK